MSAAGKKKRCAYLFAPSSSSTPGSSTISTPKLENAPTNPVEALLNPPPLLIQCSSPAMRMVGNCPHCGRNHCAKHRLPEDHKCRELDIIKGKAFEMNKEKLEREAREAKTPVAAV